MLNKCDTSNNSGHNFPIGSVLASSFVDRGFESRLDQTKDCTIFICCLSAKNSALWNNSILEITVVVVQCKPLTLLMFKYTDCKISHHHLMCRTKSNLIINTVNLGI
jgi:hypothetical protein